MRLGSAGSGRLVSLAVAFFPQQLQDILAELFGIIREKDVALVSYVQALCANAG